MAHEINLPKMREGMYSDAGLKADWSVPREIDIFVAPSQNIYAVEASTIGLPPGVWPSSLCVKNIDEKSAWGGIFHKTSSNRSGWVYSNSKKEIHILND